ncbi:hypothetical protein DOTSEDRAFT_172437 [Dothistroma septosporum NZE10]|uniref:HAUS augmin-like complex subunit 3 N-terminal domain-containing protein n=1 Tax=Dothistroma septosporum (strain NZE10 / CBS 128990) TaxID=675120 RepID=N1PPD6_DOTSN|nr:hypothetical protein DOTSEDRAFT_172437 [Dothistroma septosporum NZE10]
MAAKELGTLLNALRDRDINLGEDDVAWAFEDKSAQDSASDWVNQYLQPSTLLTKDELEYDQQHQTRGTPSLYDLGRPISDAEYEAAIVSLEASTAAIDRQSEILGSQKHALHDIKARNAIAENNASVQENRQKKLGCQRAQLDLDVDELAQALQVNVRSSLKQGDVTTAGLPSAVERLFEKDDRLLDGLQKLLPKLTDSSQDEDEAKDIEHLCAMLAELSVQEIHARLDKAYRECVSDHDHLQYGSRSKELSAQQLKQQKNLRLELEELNGEVDGLVSIVVDHQYRKPLKDGMLSSLASAQAQKYKWSEYTISALSYLTARLDALADHVEQVHAQASALRALLSAMTETLATPDTRPGAAQKHPSPMLSTPSAKGLKPLRLVQANLSESQDPAVSFLRHHEVHCQERGSDVRLTSALLTSALRDRKQRLDHLLKSTEDTVSAATAKSVSRTDTHVQDLLSAVYAQSCYGTTHLVDSDLQAQLDKLEHKTQKLGDEMRDIDVDAVAHVAKAKQEAALRKLAGP